MFSVYRHVYLCRPFVSHCRFCFKCQGASRLYYKLCFQTPGGVKSNHRAMVSNRLIQCFPVSSHTTCIIFIINVLFCQEKWIFHGWQNMIWSPHWATARLRLNCVNFPSIFRSIPLRLSYVPASKVLMNYIVGMLTATSSSFTPVLFVAKENQFNNTVVHIWNKQHTAQMFYDAFMYCITPNHSKKF